VADALDVHEQTGAIDGERDRFGGEAPVTCATTGRSSRPM